MAQFIVSLLMKHYVNRHHS